MREGNGKMAKILITGAADGLGQLAARALIGQGHQVVLHARNAERGRWALQQAPGAEHVIVGDLSDLDAAKDVAEQANGLGRFDAVIHNAGVYQAAGREIFVVNTLAPYVLTCLMRKPRRLIYLSSDMHLQGSAGLEHFTGNLAVDGRGVRYSDSKLYVVMLCLAAARRWPDVYANAVDPGWVPTKMGGRGAPDDLEAGYATQVWLAVSDDRGARVSGRYFYHRAERRCHPQAADVGLQERLLGVCQEMTGVGWREAG